MRTALLVVSALALTAPAAAQANQNAPSLGAPDAGRIAADAGRAAVDAGAPSPDAGGGAGESAKESAEDEALFGGSTAADGGAVSGGGTGESAKENAEDEALFGSQPASSPDAGVPGQAPPPGPASPGEPAQKAEQALFAGPGTLPQTHEEVAPMNPLTLGGTLYLRGQLTGYQDEPPKSWGWSMPNLLDVYLDARPNSRVRALAVGRLTYDPTVDTSIPSFNGQTPSQLNTYLDQLWINFDILHTVFMTIGKQHVKWGTGHFWNPTDYLQPVRLNPLDIFDERTGVTMVKAHVPWEARGWNFYAFAVFQNPSGFVDTLGQIGGAARAEIVLGTSELGLDALVQHGRKPHFGADLSSGLGPFDVFVEAGFHGADAPKIALNLPPQGQTVSSIADLITEEPVTGIQPQITAGGSLDFNIDDRDAMTVGAEGFYNSTGYDDPKVYPALIFTGNYTPFYVGKWYAALYATANLPRGEVTHTLTFTTIGNISDASFISRLDYSVTVLTHLGLEIYADGHYGTEGGEFRFGFNPASIPVGTGELPPVVLPTPTFDLGLALRVSM